MFLRKNNKNNDNLSKKINPSFVEKNILIPNIATIIKTISFLFEEMKEIHHKLKDDKTEYAQDFKKDLKEMLIDYNRTKFTSPDLAIMKQIEDVAENEVNEMAKILLDGISSHIEQYRDLLRKLGTIQNHESDMEKISEYMIKAQSFMSNIAQFKKKIFSYIVPMTTLVMIDPQTKKEVKRFPKDHPVEKIGLLPFETRIDEVASLCENGIRSINSWFGHLKNRRIQYFENIVHQNKVQAAQAQTKAAKWTFCTQLGFMVLSVCFIVVSFSLSHFKDNWINLFTSTKVTKEAKNTKNIKANKQLNKCVVNDAQTKSKVVLDKKIHEKRNTKNQTKK